METQTEQTIQTQDRSISLLRANFVMVYFAVPAVLIPGLLWYALWGMEDIAAMFWTPGIGVMVLLTLIPGIVVHEVLHAVAWAWSANLPLSNIRFGFHWKTVTPYAHCKVAITARAYRIGAVTPLLVLGVLPCAIALALGSAPLLAFGLFFTFAAGGDMLILWLIRDVVPTALVEDHPTRAGCLVRLEQKANG